jgi:hypothetical protein
MREAPEPFRPTKALFHTSILAACGSDRRYRSHALIPGSKSTSWKSALACRTRSQTPLKKLEAVGHVFGTTDPDQGARAAALIEQAITLIESCGPQLQRLACKWGSVADGE